MPGLFRCRGYFQSGFTLAELLVALLILGVIAAFTIPKVLQQQQNSQWNSAAKEVAAMASGALEAYRATGRLDGTTETWQLTPYMNYVSLDTVSQLDANQGSVWAWECSQVSRICLRMHTGGTVLMVSGQEFGGTERTNAIYYIYDPDGQFSGSASGPGKSMAFFLLYSGRVTDDAGIEPNTCDGAMCYNPNPGLIADWFSWD